MVKVLQIRLQTILPEVIHEGQSAFFPSRFILDSVVVQHETIAWAQETNQPLIMLKLDFSKAYDTVRWGFLFQVMLKMGMPETLVQLIKMLLVDVSAAVSINGLCSNEFPRVPAGAIFVSYRCRSISHSH